MKSCADRDHVHFIIDAKKEEKKRKGGPVHLKSAVLSGAAAILSSMCSGCERARGCRYACTAVLSACDSATPVIPKRPSAWPPPRRLPQHRQNFWAAESLQSITAVTKVNKQSEPAHIAPSESLPPRRKARLLRRARCGASPGDRYVTPPKTLWHNYTSVALKGEGRRGRGGRRSEGARSGGVVGAGGCFTPGLFKETAQGMPLALLTKHFSLSLPPSLPLSLFFLFLFFLPYCWVRSSQILWAPVPPPQPFEDASETFSQTFGPVWVLMFPMNNPGLLRPGGG